MKLVCTNDGCRQETLLDDRGGLVFDLHGERALDPEVVRCGRCGSAVTPMWRLSSAVPVQQPWSDQPIPFPGEIETKETP